VTIRVGDIAEQVRGVSYAKSDASSTPGPDLIPILRANNITDDGLTFGDLVYVPKSRVSNRQTLRTGDIVIAASSGSLDVVGKAARLTGEFQGAFGAFCKVLRPKSNIVDHAYLAHFFRTQSYRKRISSLAAGANINNLKNEHLDDLEIPLPPLDEQRRIAAILDKADALRRKRKRAIELLDGLTQSIFLEMFGNPITNPMKWPKGNLGIVCDVRDGTHASPKYVKVGRPLLTSKNFSSGTIDYTDAKQISVADYDEINKRSKVDIGDIVMPMIGTIGSPVLIREEPQFAIKNLALFKFQAKFPLAEFVLKLLDGPLLEEKILNSSRGGTQKFLSLGDLRNLQIPLPPTDLQLTFKQIFDRHSKTRAHYGAGVLSADNLFSSLQHRAFSGQL
jgi:type I restriction enzyme S subunit